MQQLFSRNSSFLKSFRQFIQRPLMTALSDLRDPIEKYYQERYDTIAA